MRFKFGSKVGEGGFGEVWRADDLELRRSVAIKLLHPDDPVTSTAQQHAQALARVEHRNVVRIYDITRLPHPTEGDERDAIVMEFLGGPTLAAVLSGPEISTRAADRICRGVIAGLAALHQEGIPHNDLSSENIQLGLEGEARLLDVLYRGTVGSRPILREQAFQRDLACLAREVGEVLVNPVGCTLRPSSDARPPTPSTFRRCSPPSRKRAVSMSLSGAIAGVPR
jgi:serine/threonine protein kinase